MLHTNRALATEEVWTGTVGLSIVVITVCNILVQVSKLYLFGKTEPKALGSSQKFLKPQGRNWGGTQFACKHWPCKREDGREFDLQTLLPTLKSWAWWCILL